MSSNRIGYRVFGGLASWLDSTGGQIRIPVEFALVDVDTAGNSNGFDVPSCGPVVGDNPIGNRHDQLPKLDVFPDSQHERFAFNERMLSRVSVFIVGVVVPAPPVQFQHFRTSHDHLEVARMVTGAQA